MADETQAKNGNVTNSKVAPPGGKTVLPPGGQIAAPSTDIDSALWLWAADQLGSGFIAENIDASGVKVTQSGVLYIGQDDWFQEQKIKHEIFNNDDKLPITWSYDETVEKDSKVIWKLTRTIKSTCLPECSLHVEYPSSGEGKQPAKAVFGLCDTLGTEKVLDLPSTYNISTPITVQPYSTVEACVHTRTCRLDNVPFKVDVTLSGPITVKGHKKRKMQHKMEVSDSVAKALKGAAGVVVLEEEDKACCTIEGVCNGEVPIFVKPLTVELQSLV